MLAKWPLASLSHEQCSLPAAALELASSYFMQSVLVLFCLKKMPWSYNSFSKKKNPKKFPYCLQSAYIKKTEILTLKYCPRTNPPTSNHHQHTNFVKGTLCYLVSLKCAYSSSDSWIRRWQEWDFSQKSRPRQIHQIKKKNKHIHTVLRFIFLHPMEMIMVLLIPQFSDRPSLASFALLAISIYFILVQNRMYALHPILYSNAHIKPSQWHGQCFCYLFNISPRWTTR